MERYRSVQRQLRCQTPVCPTRTDAAHNRDVPKRSNQLPSPASLEVAVDSSAQDWHDILLTEIGV